MEFVDRISIPIDLVIVTRLQVPLRGKTDGPPALKFVAVNNSQRYVVNHVVAEDRGLSFK